MTEKERITTDQIVKKQEETKAKYEADIATAHQEILSLKNTITEKNDEIFELQKENKKVAEDRDDYKQEVLANRKVYKETKKEQTKSDFLTEFSKLQETKTSQRINN